MEQEPGPRGSPQVPQEPASPNDSAPSAEASPPPPTAKVENCFSRSPPPHPGQEGGADPITRASNRFEQDRQMYSNSGIVIPRIRSRRKNNGGGVKKEGATR